MPHCRRFRTSNVLVRSDSSQRTDTRCVRAAAVRWRTVSGSSGRPGLPALADPGSDERGRRAHGVRGDRPRRAVRLAQYDRIHAAGSLAICVSVLAHAGGARVQAAREYGAPAVRAEREQRAATVATGDGGFLERIQRRAARSTGPPRSSSTVSSRAGVSSNRAPVSRRRPPSVSCAAGFPPVASAR
jgi:hypothetical protein